MSVELLVRYDGLDASHHRIDLRKFGHALVGLDHVLTHGVFALAEARLPRQRERLPFDILASEPQRGSVEVLATLMSAIQASQGNLPFLVEAMKVAMPELLWDWVSWVFKHLGGRPKEADPHFVRLMDFTDKLHRRELGDREAQRAFFLQVLDRVQGAAANVVSPVGDSSNVIEFKAPTTGHETVLDVPMAEAVRSKGQMTVGDLQRLEIRIDGLIKHSNRLTVELPSEPGKFIPAEVRDPAFEFFPNPYLDALSSNSPLKVLAKPTYRSDGLQRLYILDTEPDA